MSINSLMVVVHVPAALLHGSPANGWHRATVREIDAFRYYEGKTIMIISERLRAFRLQKKLSQGDIEKRTGLKRCYISRVENGHTVPSIETLEKMARALEVPLYQLFYDGEEPPKLESLPKGVTSGGDSWGSSGYSARSLYRLRHLLGRLREDDRQLLLHLASQLARRHKS